MRYLVSGLVAGFLLSISLLTKQEKLRTENDTDAPAVGKFSKV